MMTGAIVNTRKYTSNPASGGKDYTTRMSGESFGTRDAYYFSPDGVRFRSIREIERFLDRKVTIFEGDRRPVTSQQYNRRPPVEDPSSDTEMFLVYGSPGS